MHVRCDNQYKTGADRGNIFGKPMLCECMGICVLSSAHEREMRGCFVYVLIVKYFSHRFCLYSVREYKIGRPYHGNFWGFFKTFLEGSVDYVIYSDYIVNRRFFLFTVVWPHRTCFDYSLAWFRSTCASILRVLKL